MFLKDSRKKKSDHSKDQALYQESNDGVFNSLVSSNSFDQSREFEKAQAKKQAIGKNQSFKESKDQDKSQLNMSKTPEKFVLDNESIYLLINALDQKFSSSQIDNDFSIGVETALNAAAELTLSKCSNAHQSLLSIMDTTNTIEMKSIELENISKDINRQATKTLEDVKQIQKSIHDVIHPRISKLLAFVSLILYIITTLLNLIQLDSKPLNDEDETASAFEQSESDDGQ